MHLGWVVEEGVLGSSHSCRLYKEAYKLKLPSVCRTNPTQPTNQPLVSREKYPTQTEEIKTKAMSHASLYFCLAVALCSAQQWDDYDSKDYNSPSDYDYRSGDQSESSDLDSGLWREEAVFLTPQDREKESLR